MSHESLYYSTMSMKEMHRKTPQPTGVRLGATYNWVVINFQLFQLTRFKCRNAAPTSTDADASTPCMIVTNNLTRINLILFFNYKFSF